jgi:hypothetical protein
MRPRSPAVAFIALILAACVAKPSSPEIQMMETAVKPTSADTAQAAVKAYFDRTLIDPQSATYRFPFPVTQGSLTTADVRQFGWFMCGEINSKNRLGGYTGYDTFLVYFSPTVADQVADGSIGDTDDARGLVARWCKGIYGL